MSDSQPTPPAGYVPPAYPTQPPQWGGPAVPPPAPWSGLAIAGFITSFFAGLVGLVLSIFGLRETKLTGKRGRGLAIAGIVVGGVGTVLGVVSVIVLIFALPAAVRSVSTSIEGRGAEPLVPVTSGFGSGDSLPADTLPSGMHQGLVGYGWDAYGTAPTAPFIGLSRLSNLKEGTDLPSYDDPTGVCTAFVDMYDGDVVHMSLYDDSVDLLEGWISGDDSGRRTGRITTAVAPAFRATDGAEAPAVGSYDVVASTFTDDQDGGSGLVWARVFRSDDREIGVVTAVICNGSTDVDQVGEPALAGHVGGAWR